MSGKHLLVLDAAMPELQLDLVFAVNSSLYLLTCTLIAATASLLQLQKCEAVLHRQKELCSDKTAPGFCKCKSRSKFEATKHLWRQTFKSADSGVASKFCRFKGGRQFNRCK